MKSTIIISFCVISPILLITACERKGPAEKAGEKVDKAVENLKEAVEPKGPMEKAGEKIDKTLGK